MEVYIGLDLGTTSMKVVAVDEKMNLLACDRCPSPLIDDGLRREFDADGFCNRVFSLLRKLMEKCDGNVKAVCAASASGNTVFLDSGMTPLMNAISWTDMRMKDKKGKYLPGLDLASVHSIVGWPYTGMFPLAHIAMVKQDKPEVFLRTAMVCMSTEYLLYRLCGKWGMDHSSASTFYLQDQVAHAFHKPYLDYLGIGENKLPPLCPSRYVLGLLTPAAAQATGLGTDTKVVTGSFDHPACARGMGALKESDLLLSLGTSWTGLYVSKKREKAIQAGMLTDVFRVEQDGLWACMFALTQYGESIDARINTYIDDSSQKFERFNAMAEHASGSRAIICDITDEEACRVAWQNVSEENIAWSIMNSACAEVTSHINQMVSKGFVAERIYMAGGPASSILWPQVMAEAIGCSIYCLHRQYGGAMGAAMMAAVGDGFVCDEKEFFRDETQYTVYSPRKGRR